MITVHTCTSALKIQM